jgi:pimeloyl-ACP methyl ester carboxylesterase
LPIIHVIDINIYYEIYGEGVPLVMITGLAGDSNWWSREEIKAYSRYFKLIIFDNRGAGRTDKPKEEYSIDQFATDVLGLMDALKIEKAHILGTSMGGMIAQEIAINHPERVERLVLCSTHCGGNKKINPSQKVLDMMTSSNQNLIDGIISLCFSKKIVEKYPIVISKFRKKISKTQIPPKSYILQLKSVDRFDAYSRLKQIIAPTLILHGKEDLLIPVSNADIIASQIPNANVKILKQEGHWIFLPNWQKLMKIIVKFLAD